MADLPILAIGGENLIDHVTRDGVVSACPGGSPFNVAMALGRQGSNVHYISPISTDSWGDMLAETLLGSGVKLDGGRNPAPTTMARVTVNDGVPSYRFERDQTAERQITGETLAAALPEAAAAIHTGSLTLTDGADAAAWEAFCGECHDAGMLVSLDPNVRLSILSDVEGYRARILRMCRRLDLLKLSDEDLEGLFTGRDEDAALTALREITSARIVVLTRGANGVSAWIGADRVDIPAALVPKLVDTVGAGDTFTATMLAGLADKNALSGAALATLTRDDLTLLLHRASTAAALNCGRSGCNPPSRDEIEAATF
ncbi:PfkB family carbohydrate kinase [Tropicimonas sp. TH_r6]|uniref:PfkB family carbohydrate kinase n=1 Tax=Tropicimonas sp. TH_r6 TaxID=3082085 RepID=UPI0029544014|nr:PfkB family carbohydrate kinase [Tropicimonas sp. TH_r6]MDV7145352.1 PfkB family carbohydrate kinase [Tropicimonas sp. TH_r6]